MTGPSGPSVYGQSDTLTATVMLISGSGMPTGTVTFYDGTTSLGSAAIDSTGKASLDVSSLDLGSHTITASYDGDPNYSGSSSGTVTQQVNQDGTTTALSSSVNPSVYGRSVVFTATVSALAPGSGPPAAP